MKNKKITAKDAEIVQKFKPTPYMEKWLDTAIELKSDSPTEISAVAEQRRENWYDWLKLEGFEDWYYEEYEKRIRRWRPYLDKVGMKFSGNGSYNHWKDMQRFAGRKEQESGDTNVKIITAVGIQRKKFDL
jgi:hypothetical protein